MNLSDSRRLTGPNFVLDRPGAAAEITLTEGRDLALNLWRTHVRTILDKLDWSDEEIATRTYDGGATIAITAPVDALYAATEIVELAWDWTIADFSNQPVVNPDAAIAEIRREIESEINPSLLSLLDAASEQGVPYVTDDDYVTLGLGRFGHSWPREDLPAPDQVNWDEISHIPTALVTGTNGKSTTVRLAAAIGAAAGHTVGFSTSDWVRVGNKAIATGDYSGPEGARLALRHEDVDMAVLETARGGLLRRGLPLPEARACLITNVAADHLGEYGILDVEALADAKFVVSKAVKQSGTLVLNADDKRLRTRGEAFGGAVSWYGLALKPADIAQTGSAAMIVEDQIALQIDGKIEPVIAIRDFAPALGGAAKHNISNALGASLLMHHLGVGVEAIRAGLSGFENSPDDNPGRGNFIEIGGVKAVLDFAHNPHSLTALTKTLGAVQAKRRIYLLGQGGDRSDQDIYDMTRVIREAEPDRIIIKEIPSKLRGREPGEVPALIKSCLAEMGYPANQVSMAGSELVAVKSAFETAQPGDLLVLLVYAERAQTLDFIDRLKAQQWQAGDPVPR